MSGDPQTDDPEYSPVSEEEFKEHLKQLFEAMNALAPTRNYVSQMVHLLPRERRQMRHAYPELFEPAETQQFLNDTFGLEISEEEVSTNYGNPAGEIEDIIKKAMEFFDDEERRRGLEEYLDEDIPNPRREWLDHRVKMAVSEPNYGDEIRAVFDTMLKYGDQQNGHRLNVERVDDLTDVEHGRLLEIKRFLVTEIGICRDRGDEFEFSNELVSHPEIIDQNI